MKKIFLILSIIALSVSCTSKYEDDVVELGNRIDKLEQKIPTIEQQISAIDESITLLKQTDEALRAKDEQLASEDEKLNMAIQELEILITDLKKYVIDPGLNSTKDWAEATFYTLKQYNAAVSTLAKLEQSIASSDDATSKEISDAISALQASFQTWVGKELSGYYSIARADAEFAALRQSIESGDQTLQGEIDDVESQIANSATELEKEYQAAIETAIEEYNGTITAELKSQLDDVNKRIDEQVAAINDKLDALEAQIGKNSEDIAKLLTRIQSLSYVHRYADGKAKMVCTSDYYSSRMSFEVSPKDAVTELEKVWKDIVSAKALGQGVGEEQFVSLPVQLVEADAQRGIITLQLSDTKLPAPIAAAAEEIQVAVQISDGNTAIVSDYIPVVKSKIEGDVFIYTTKDGNIFEPIADAFDANIVSNTYDKEENIGVISFDSPITSINSIVYLADEGTTIDGSDNITSIIIPNCVTTIGGYAFSGCTSLTSITIPDSVTSIGNTAFNNCTSLTSVTIPDSVTSIGNTAFLGCTSLTSITIPDSVTSIGMYAFYNCTSLESVTIPDSVTDINKEAFRNCTSLESVYISDIAAWCRIDFGTAFSNPLYYAHNLYLNGELVTNLVIPDGVTSIGNTAFLGCTSLTSITIPNSVTEIGWHAFEGCTSLESVTIPDGVTEIGIAAFRGCTSLTSITIPDSVTEIGEEVFKDCSSLTNVYIHSIIPPGDSDIFENAPIEAIYVCEQSVSLYKEKWSKYADKIFSIGPNDEIVMIHYDCGGEYLDFNQLNNLIIKGVSSNTIFLEKQEYYNFDYAFVDNKDLRSITLPEGVTSLTGTFENCTSLTSITIPESVTEIGKDAFKNCTWLDSVYISDIAAWCKIDFYWSVSYYDSLSNPLRYANNLYLNGELVTNLVIPDGVTEIGSYAFYNYDSLTSVTIPDSVTKIGSSAFSGCESLTSVTIGNGVTSIGEDAFYGCSSLTSITIPDGVTWINDYTFYKCTSLTSVTIPDGVTEIGEWAFCDCNSLTSVTIPDGVTEIGEGAFNHCTSLARINIPDSVTKIGKVAFKNCTGELIINNRTIIETNYSYSNRPAEEDGCLYGSQFTKITIGDNITQIGRYAFADYTSLTSVSIGNGVTEIGWYAFEGCTSLESVYISDIAAWCGFDFYYSSSNPLYYAHNLYLNGELVTNLVIPDGVTSITKNAFYGCTSLTSVTIPDSVTSIGGSAFYDCTSLTSVTIPDSVTSIGWFAFYGCKSLAYVYCRPTTPPSIGSEVFYSNASGQKIYVPTESVDTYKEDEDWSRYGSRITGYDF